MESEKLTAHKFLYDFFLSKGMTCSYEQFLELNKEDDGVNNTLEVMKLFAQHHVNAALDAAESAASYSLSLFVCHDDQLFDVISENVLDSYPKENI